MAQAMVESIPLSHLTIVPGARHLTPVEIPERVADLLRTVIQRSEDDVANRR
jgi:pimeloyl-ACP methyl ester carboxylesterase